MNQKNKKNHAVGAKQLHGNAARIDPLCEITPLYTTNIITPKGKKTPTAENVLLAKKYVDENHL